MQPSKAFQHRAAKSADIFSVNELKILTDGWKTKTHWHSDKLSTDENQRKTLGEQFWCEWQTQTDLLCRSMMTREIISRETIGCWISNRSMACKRLTSPAKPLVCDWRSRLVRVTSAVLFLSCCAREESGGRPADAPSLLPTQWNDTLKVVLHLACYSNRPGTRTVARLQAN